MNWTRAHDAWIAEHCEGLEVSTEFGAEPHEIRFYGPWKPVAAYNTDPAACIRAAEAWRKKLVGRSYRVFSAIDHADNSEPETAYCDGPCRSPISSAEGPFGLAQALYRASGGPV